LTAVAAAHLARAWLPIVSMSLFERVDRGESIVRASTISAALVTSCVLALAVSAQPASALQEERAPIQIPSDQELDELEAAQLQRKLAKAKSDLAAAKLKDRLNCEKVRNADRAGASPSASGRQSFLDFLGDEKFDASDSVLNWPTSGNWYEYADEACEHIERDEFMVMSGAEFKRFMERFREAKAESDRLYYGDREYMMLKNGTLFRLDRSPPEDFSEDPEGSDNDTSGEDRGADGAGIDDLDDDAGGDFGDDPDPRPTTGGGAKSDDFEEDPEGSDDDAGPSDDSTAGSSVDPDAVIAPKWTGATGLSGQFETSNENGIVFGAVIWWLYGPGGVEVQNYRRNQLLVDLVPGATYRVVAKELGENGRTAELTFTPQGTGFTFSRGLRFQ